MVQLLRDGAGNPSFWRAESREQRAWWSCSSWRDAWRYKALKGTDVRTLQTQKQSHKMVANYSFFRRSGLRRLLAPPSRTLCHIFSQSRQEEALLFLIISFPTKANFSSEKCCLAIGMSNNKWHNSGDIESIYRIDAKSSSDNYLVLLSCSVFKDKTCVLIPSLSFPYRFVSVMYLVLGELHPHLTLLFQCHFLNRVENPALFLIPSMGLR